MPEEQVMPSLPPDAPEPWLARNKKIVILGGVAIVLGVAVIIFTQVQPLASGPTTVTSNQANSAATPETGTSTRPTFQRSPVANTATTLPPTYRPPTTEDLRQAITNIHSSTTPKP